MTAKEQELLDSYRQQAESLSISCGALRSRNLQLTSALQRKGYPLPELADGCAQGELEIATKQAAEYRRQAEEAKGNLSEVVSQRDEARRLLLEHERTAEHVRGELELLSDNCDALRTKLAEAESKLRELRARSKRRSRGLLERIAAALTSEETSS